MKVLSITPTFFPQVGGLEQVVLELALRVRNYGVQMDVAHVACGLHRITERIQDVAVHRVPLHGNRIVGWAPALRRLARSYDLLHVHDPQLLAITANVRTSCNGIPAVLSTHGGFWHTDRGYLLKRLYEATLLRGAAGHYRRVLATSVGDFEYYKRYVSRIALCSNGVHVRQFNEVSQSCRSGLFRWIYWGRLSRNKRIDLVIDYVAHARQLGYPVQMLICGQDFDGLSADLHAKVARMALADVIRFEPYLDNGALRAELAQRDVYITASEHEGFGLSVVEAMAAGLVVVCRDIAPLNALCTHGRSGWLQSFDGSLPDLRSLSELLSSSPEKAASMSSAAREAAAKHDWDVAAPRFVRHYREVLAP